MSAFFGCGLVLTPRGNALQLRLARWLASGLFHFSTLLAKELSTVEMHLSERVDFVAQVAGFEGGEGDEVHAALLMLSRTSNPNLRLICFTDSRVRPRIRATSATVPPARKSFPALRMTETGILRNVLFGALRR